MTRQRHYRNSDECGRLMFVTTTVLDFVHAFRRDEPREAMALAIARRCKLSKATLHAYVVMPHHVHLVIKLDDNMNIQRFMNTLKRESSRVVKPLLTPVELNQLAHQCGLNGHTFWQRSFRSIEIVGEKMFWIKANYIHDNPVRGGLVERAEDYRCSSAKLLAEGRWSEDFGIGYDDVVNSLSPGLSGGRETEMCED